MVGDDPPRFVSGAATGQDMFGAWSVDKKSDSERPSMDEICKETTVKKGKLRTKGYQASGTK